MNHLMRKYHVDGTAVPGRKLVSAVESWRSAEVEGVAVGWTERRGAVEESPALVLQEWSS